VKIFLFSLKNSYSIRIITLINLYLPIFSKQLY
jgi:hypothetical protein